MKTDYVKQNMKLELPVQLSNLEIAELAHARGRLEADLSEAEQDYADVKKDWGEKLEHKRREIAQLGIDIRSGKQSRPVMCDEIFRNGTIQTIRQDTSEVVGTRPASMQEAQRHLPNVIAGNPNVLDQAAAAQKASGSEEDEDGDVIPPMEDAPKKKGSKKSAKKKGSK